MNTITDSELIKTSLWLQKVNKAPNKKLYRLLIVDDQPEIRNLLALTLDADNYELHHANNWVTALAMTRAIKPDLVLLDVMMPGEFDGLEVCRRIKADKELSSTIVMIISARSQVADKQQGMESGADDYLTKPFSPLMLMEKVSMLLAKKDQPDIK
jgi:DNA-binding response OmpR family regulator